MTLDGTNTWLLAGAAGGPAIVVNPGPDDPRTCSASSIKLTSTVWIRG